MAGFRGLFYAARTWVVCQQGIRDKTGCGSWKGTSTDFQLLISISRDRSRANGTNNDEIARCCLSRGWAKPSIQTAATSRYKTHLFPRGIKQRRRSLANIYTIHVIDDTWKDLDSRGCIESEVAGICRWPGVAVMGRVDEMLELHFFFIFLRAGTYIFLGPWKNIGLFCPSFFWNTIFCIQDKGS